MDKLYNKTFRFLILFFIILGLFSPNYNFLQANSRTANLIDVSKALDEIKSFLNFYFFKKSKSSISQDEVVHWTNVERLKNNLPSLEKDLELEKVAEIRLSDMEEKQYFDHYSPEGRGISDEAFDFEYQYISIGENIAQGNFKDSKDLVQAWMDSPGHRENILKDQYSKIGIAAREVVFEGKKTWIIVQAFSRPITDCIEPSIVLKNTIEEDRSDLKILLEKTGKTLSVMTNSKANGNNELYNDNVPIYNDLVQQANKKTQNLQNNISRYNREVSLFNICIEN